LTFSFGVHNKNTLSSFSLDFFSFASRVFLYFNLGVIIIFVFELGFFRLLTLLSLFSLLIFFVNHFVFQLHFLDWFNSICYNLVLIILIFFFILFSIIFFIYFFQFQSFESILASNLILIFLIVNCFVCFESFFFSIVFFGFDSIHFFNLVLIILISFYFILNLFLLISFSISSLNILSNLICVSFFTLILMISICFAFFYFFFYCFFYFIP
jgi:hypothetical protein